jgi:hypothetical protein
MADQTNPLLQFDSPRQAYNSSEYTTTPSGVALTGQGTKLTAGLLLGPGLTVSFVPSSPAPGAVQYALISGPDVAALEARVTALEAVVAIGGGETVLKNPQGQTLLRLAQDAGSPAISFFNNTPQPRVTIDPFEATADLAQNIAFDLNAKGLSSAP